MPDKVLKKEEQDERDIAEADDILQINLFIQCSLNTYYMPGMMTGIGDTATYNHSFVQQVFIEQLQSVSHCSGSWRYSSGSCLQGAHSLDWGKDN